MVSILTLLALGSAGICAALSLDFYRKYRTRLQVGTPVHHYARVADYNGVPLPLAFEYRSEGNPGWSKIEADVHEVYHYGADYFMRGYRIPDRKGVLIKWNRIAKLSFRSDGRTLGSVDALLGVAEGREGRQAVIA